MSVLSHSVMLDSVTTRTDHRAPLSMGFPRQVYWSGLPFPPPGGLPDPGIKLMSLVCPALQVDFFFLITEPLFKLMILFCIHRFMYKHIVDFLPLEIEGIRN